MKLFGTQTDTALKDRAREQTSKFVRSLEKETAVAEEKMLSATAETKQAIAVLNKKKEEEKKRIEKELREANAELAHVKLEIQNTLDKATLREKATKKEASKLKKAQKEYETALLALQKAEKTAETRLKEATENQKLSRLQIRLANEEREKTNTALLTIKDAEQRINSVLNALTNEQTAFHAEKEQEQALIATEWMKLRGLEKTLTDKKQELDNEQKLIDSKRDALQIAIKTAKKYGIDTNRFE